MLIHVPACIRTLRLKVKSEAYAWLNAAAIEVNQVWNWANETSYKAARPFAGPGKWLSGFDLDKLAAGATDCFDHIGSDTIQRVNAEFSTRRRQFKKSKLRWRVSRGAKRSLGWIPFKAVQLKRKGKSLRFSGKAFRVFERELLEGTRWKCGCFAQDSVATSDGDKLEAGHFYRNIELKIAQAQRRGHKRQAKRLHRRAARRRKEALHKFSRKIIDQYQSILVGDVSSAQLARTRMAKSVLDAGWGMLKAQLQYKGEYAGRSVRIVSERYTTQTCSSCGARTGPTGLDMCAVRRWMCSECGDTHDRDVNAAKNILSAGRLPPSVSGNESSCSAAPTSQAVRRGESGKRALKKAA
jgi:putative transposase